MLSTAQDHHRSDPEEFYVKQDRIGACGISKRLPCCSNAAKSPHRKRIFRRSLQGVSTTFTFRNLKLNLPKLRQTHSKDGRY